MRGTIQLDAASVLALIFQIIGIALLIKRSREGVLTLPLVSMILFVLLDTLALVSTLFVPGGAVNGQLLGAVIGNVVLLYAIATRPNKPVWSRSDTFVLVGGLTGVVLWWMFDKALYALVASMAVGLLAGVKGFVESWKEPDPKSFWSWVFLTLSGIPVLLTADHTLVALVQPMVFSCLNVGFLLIHWFAPYVKMWMQRQRMGAYSTE